jgi:hypothetical protein
MAYKDFETQQAAHRTRYLKKMQDPEWKENRRLISKHRREEQKEMKGTEAAVRRMRWMAVEMDAEEKNAPE